MTVICPRCGAWMLFTRDESRYFTLRYEIPCQRCGEVFALGARPKDASTRYFWFYVSVFPPSHSVWRRDTLAVACLPTALQSTA